MAKAIDKAWSINLTFPKEEQWDYPETIISETCPHNEDFNIRLKDHTHKDGSVRCSDFGHEDNVNKCTRCWNCEIEEDEGIAKSTFKELRTCPSNTDIVINENNEDTFAKAIKDNDIIVYIENDTDIYYDEIPEIIKWLQDVYDYATELKNRIEYVDFNTAKEYMEEDSKNIARYKDYEYYIKDNKLRRNDDDGITALTLEAINSKEWILL